MWREMICKQVCWQCMKFDVAVCLTDIVIFSLSLLSFFSQLWETTKVHTSSAICLKRDCDVLFDQEEIIVSAADNCNRLQVSLRANEAVYHTYIRPSYRRLCVRARAFVCLRCATARLDLCSSSQRRSPPGSGAHVCAGTPLLWS